MTRYKDYINKMLSENEEVFNEFRKIHNEYTLNPEKWQVTFNEKGAKVLDIVKEYENRLCANTERGKYIKYSSSLAEKFQNEVRKIYPMIDHIGIKIITSKNSVAEKFSLKKINLNNRI